MGSKLNSIVNFFISLQLVLETEYAVGYFVKGLDNYSDYTLVCVCFANKKRIFRAFLTVSGLKDTKFKFKPVLNRN